MRESQPPHKRIMRQYTEEQEEIMRLHEIVQEIAKYDGQVQERMLDSPHIQIVSKVPIEAITQGPAVEYEDPRLRQDLIPCTQSQNNVLVSPRSSTRTHKTSTFSPQSSSKSLNMHYTERDDEVMK